MSFWDNVKKFTQPYSDEDYDDYEDQGNADYAEETQETAPRGRRNASFTTTQDSTPSYSSASTSFGGSVVSMGSGKQEVVLFHAKSFDDAARAADELRKKKAIILNMENIDKSLTRRVVDFLSGSVYALDGSVKKIAQSTYLFCPHNMDVVGDLENISGEIESYV